MGKRNVRGLLVLGLLVGSLGISACNTVEGFGQDVKKGGAAIEREADKAK